MAQVSFKLCPLFGKAEVHEHRSPLGNGRGEIFLVSLLAVFISVSAQGQQKSQISTPESSANREVVFIPLKYQSPKDMIETLKDMLGDIKARADERRNGVVIYDSREKIEQAKKIIAVYNQLLEHVIISVLVAEVSHSDSNKVGWELKDYNVPLQTILPPNVKSLTANSIAGIFPGWVSIAGENAKIKVIASPSVMVIEKHKAQLGSGDRVPIPISQSQVVQGQVATSTSVQFEEVGVKLTVTPHILSETEEIILEVAGEVSSIGKYTSQGYPQISTRNFQSDIKLKNGWTAVLGGLLKEEQRDKYTGIPYIMDIPLLGMLFRNNKIEKVQSEVKITLTPLIVTEEMLKKAPEGGLKPPLRVDDTKHRSETGSGAWRSILVPGLWQVYNGYDVKGYTIMGIEAASISGAIAFGISESNARKADNSKKTADNNKLKNTFIGISAGLWLLNIADAYLISDYNSSSSQLFQRIDYEVTQLPVVSNTFPQLAYDVKISPNTFLGFSVRF